MLTTPAVQATFDRTRPADALSAAWDRIVPETQARIGRLALTAAFFHFMAHEYVGEVPQLDERGRMEADIAAAELHTEIERFASPLLAVLSVSAPKPDAA